MTPTVSKRRESFDSTRVLPWKEYALRRDVMQPTSPLGEPGSNIPYSTSIGDHGVLQLNTVHCEAQF